MKKIRVALAGVGNCASNLIQGIQYYKNNPNCDVGLSHRVFGGFDVSDIEIVAAFDIASNKVNKDVSEAIFQSPNCTEVICDVPFMGVKVHKAPVLDGWDTHLKDKVEVSDYPDCNVREVLVNTKPDVLIVLLPTGSVEACLMYITTALQLGIAVINGIPVLSTHDSKIVEMAVNNKTAIIGDDFKSQIGGAILHHSLMHLLDLRGVKISNSYQLNFAGNTDFLNLITRGATKHASKARGVKAGLEQEVDLSINVSYLENCNDKKTCIIHIEGENFSRCPITIDAKLTVIDSANASGVMIDAIRCIAKAKEKGIYGRLDAPSSFFMKSPFIQMPDDVVHQAVEEFMCD